MPSPQHTLLLRLPSPNSPDHQATMAKASSGPNICTHCSSTKSPLWRRGEMGEVLCNACGLYWKHHGIYRPLDQKHSENKNRSSSGSKRHQKETARRTALLPIDHNLTTNSTQPNSAPKFSSIKKQPVLRPALAPRTVPKTKNMVQFIMHGAKMLFPGDHVVVAGSDGHPYYAILADFSAPDPSKKQCLLRWLLPREEYAEVISFTSSLEPEMFVLGPEHDKWESVAAILDVFYSPTANNISPCMDDLEAAHMLCSLEAL